MINIKIAKFPPIVVRFWSMFWGSSEASIILTFSHNMKHLSDFQKRFSENKYLIQSKSNLIFTKMQKRRFDAREALSLAGTLERFVDDFLKWESHTGTNQLSARPGRAAAADHSHTCTRPGGEYNLSPNYHLFLVNVLSYLTKSLNFCQLSSVFDQCFEEAWKLLWFWHLITIWNTFQISRNVFQKINILNNQRVI